LCVLRLRRRARIEPTLLSRQPDRNAQK